MTEDTNNVIDNRAENGEIFNCQNNKKGTPNDLGESVIGSPYK